MPNSDASAMVGDGDTPKRPHEAFPIWVTMVETSNPHCLHTRQTHMCLVDEAHSSFIAFCYAATFWLLSFKAFVNIRHFWCDIYDSTLWLSFAVCLSPTFMINWLVAMARVCTAKRLWALL